MDFILKILIYLCLCAKLHCLQQMSWLACTFNDEHEVIGSFHNEKQTVTEVYPRDALLQFGLEGDPPVKPHIITFMITASKVDLRRYVEGEGVDQDQVECEVRRYKPEGVPVRWPGHGAQEDDRWFISTLRHSKGLFTASAFLRHTPAAPPAGPEDGRRQLAVEDGDTVITTVAMVLQTRSPSVRTGLQSDPKLHCQFAVDHRAPNVSVSWRLRRRSEYTTVFSHASHSGETHGRGVGVKGLPGGDVSLSLVLVKMNSEGVYICSVHVPPLTTSEDVTLRIIEPPRVSLNIGPSVSLQEGDEQKVICLAEDYYPLDVEIEWYRESPTASGQRVGAPLPKPVPNILFSTHKHNRDGTYSLSAFFYLQASLRDSGSQYSCRVSHTSIRMPVRKSFILTVHEMTDWMLYGVVLALSIILLVLLYYLHTVRRGKRRPY